jgi:hypothetical protein
MIESGRFNTNEGLARFRRRQLLRTDLNHLRTARAECASNVPLH